MKRDRGAVLITLLIVTVVVMMFIGALLLRSRSNLSDTTHNRNSVKAEQAARAGVNHLLRLMAEDPTWNQPLEATWSGATYTVTFDPSEPAFSVNNLTSDVVSTQASFQGHSVAPQTADIVVVGSCGLARRTVRVVGHRGFSFLRSVSAAGRIELSGDVEVAGVTSLLAPEGAPGGLMSKFRSTDPAEPAIGWDGGGSFQLDQLSKLEAAPAHSGGASFSANLPALFPDQAHDNSAADTIPDIDISSKVTEGLSHPEVAPGGSALVGNVYLDSPGSVNGDLSVIGDIILTEGTLYLDGDLNLNGGLKGRGTIYVSGDVHLVGGNTLVQAGEPSGVALLVGGDASFQGIDATGYLDTLASSSSAISTAQADMMTQLDNYESVSNGDHFGTCRNLSNHVGAGPSPTEDVWVSPIPGPDGRHMVGYESGILPALTLAIKDTGLHLTDPRARKVLSAIEEMQYHFRENGTNRTIDMTDHTLNEDYQVVDSSGTVLSRAEIDLARASSPWDDDGLSDKFRTNCALQYGVGGLNWRQLSEDRKTTYFEHNPMDFSFLGNSVFQGGVYVKGNVEASQGFEVIGGLATLGDLTFTGGSKFIMNEEYAKLLGPDVPIGIVHFEEI